MPPMCSMLQHWMPRIRHTSRGPRTLTPPALARVLDPHTDKGKRFGNTRDDGTAQLLQTVRSLYEGPGSLATALRGHGSVAEWEATYGALNALTDDWLTLATGILEGVDPSYVRRTSSDPTLPSLTPVRDFAFCSHPSRTVHVLVSSSHLLPLLIKCILFKLQPHFAVDHLYSSARFGTLLPAPRVAASPCFNGSA